MLVLLNWELKILAVQENVELCFPPLYDDNCSVFCIIIKKLDILARILTKMAHSAFYDILMILYTHYIVTDNVATRRVAAVLVLPSVSLHACIRVFVFPYIYCFALLCNANLESRRNIAALNTCIHTVFTFNCPYAYAEQWIQNCWHGLYNIVYDSYTQSGSTWLESSAYPESHFEVQVCCVSQCTSVSLRT